MEEISRAPHSLEMDMSVGSSNERGPLENRRGQTTKKLKELKKRHNLSGISISTFVVEDDHIKLNLAWHAFDLDERDVDTLIHAQFQVSFGDNSASDYVRIDHRVSDQALLPFNFKELIENELPFKFSVFGAENPYLGNIKRIYTHVSSKELAELIVIPFKKKSIYNQGWILLLYSEEKLSPHAIYSMWIGCSNFVSDYCDPTSDRNCAGELELSKNEYNCIRWVVAGKTLEDVAQITGIPYRTVRYHIEQVRQRMGYATNLQVYVRAAIEYGLDPMGRYLD